jgi:hypothetical protein
LVVVERSGRLRCVVVGMEGKQAVHGIDNIDSIEGGEGQRKKQATYKVTAK